MESTPDVWAEILRKAVEKGLEKNKSGPIPGARLRELVASCASEVGLTYPPSTNTSLKFVNFLEQHPNVVAVRRQPHGDLFVAPADKPELLIEAPTPHLPLPGIRQDLFEAFTRVHPNLQAWYDRNTGQVKWQRIDEPPDFTKFARIPPPTIDDLRITRKTFSLEQSDPQLKQQLLEAAENPVGLAAFSAVVKDNGLGKAWHQFRVRILVDRIGIWAKEAGITWQDSWLTASSRGESIATGTTRYDLRDWRRSLETLLTLLDKDDLARVSVPLDIVLRIIEERR